MGELKIGDIVARKSHGLDILFKVSDIKRVGKDNVVILKGLCYRIEADAPVEDLVVQDEQQVRMHDMSISRMVENKLRSAYSSNYRNLPKKARYRNTPKDKYEKFTRPGKILHIDGDKDYLDNCMEHYKKLGLEAIGVHIPEKDQAAAIFRLLVENKPDILVLTGHDGMIKGNQNYHKMSNYRNSRHYIDAVLEARRYEKNPDSLIIFAGACQSMFNGIIEAGANFASSPYRVLIHALDPVLICQNIALSGVDRLLDPKEVIGNTITGFEGLGGIETRGKYRVGYPSEPYK